MKYYISPPPMNPVSRVLAAVVAAIALAGAVFFGLVVFLALLGMLLVFGLVLGIRSWWLGRRPGVASESRTPVERDASVIDAEYTVVSRRRN
jgi:hypothetical protein